MRKKLTLGITAVIASWVLTYISTYIIIHYFPNRPFADDLFFRLVPHYAWMSYIADLSIVVAFICLGAITLKKPQYIDRILYSLAIMWSVRSIINTLTPLGDPSGDNLYGFLEFTPMFGMFPSGHTATVMVAFVWSALFKEPKIRTISLIALCAVMISLLSSRGHYSIDILGGIILGYCSVALVVNPKVFQLSEPVE